MQAGVLPWLLSVHCRLCILTLLLCFQVLATQNLVSKVWSSDLCLRSFFGVEHQESCIINTSQTPRLFSLGAFYPGEAGRKWASDVMMSFRFQASVICNHLQHTHICTCATVITTCSCHYQTDAYTYVYTHMYVNIYEHVCMYTFMSMYGKVRDQFQVSSIALYFTFGDIFFHWTWCLKL